MKQEPYDIVIVGAGPAGTVFARELALARPELRLLLIDGQTADAAKPCGGLLAPDAQKLLARFDLALPKEVLADPQIFAVETIDLGRRMVRYYQRHYLNMDRYAFDAWLLSLVPRQVEVIRGKCTDIQTAAEGYILAIRRGSEVCTVQAQALVGADGAGSVVRRCFFRPVQVQYVAIQQWFENQGQRLPYYSCIFDRETSDSCSWTIHKGDHVIFGGAFHKRGCRQAFERQRARLEAYLGSSFGQAVKTEACLVSSPRSMKDYCTGTGQVFLLGEAAGFISASSFEGLSSAMYSGKMLADAMAGTDTWAQAQQQYRKRTRSLRLKLRLKSIKRMLLCSPFIRGLILRSGIQSIQPYPHDTR